MRQTDQTQRMAEALSFGDILSANRGVGPGFDFLRIFLALSIVLAHSEQIATGVASPYDHPLWLLVYLQVPAFFALSGFLVAGSASRLSLPNFLMHRALRIYPALITEVVLSIFLIGLTFTTVSFAEFFTSKDLYLYLTNLFGAPHYHLPGVFADNPFRLKVNGSIWTVQFELLCYAIMAATIWTGALRSNVKIVAMTFGITVLSLQPGILDLIFTFWRMGSFQDAISCIKINSVDADSALTLAYFCFGVSFYQFRDRIPYRRAWVMAGAGVLLIVSLLGDAHMNDLWFKALLLPVCVYLTLFIGLTRMPLPAFLRSGDYSYGIYLYGFPVQQAVQSLTHTQGQIALNFLVSVPIIFAWSVFSWRFVEKPALRLKKRLTFAPRTLAGEPALDMTVARTARAPATV